MKRRRVTQLVLLLVLLISGGAIVNVAVASGLTLVHNEWREAANETFYSQHSNPRDPPVPYRSSGAYWILFTPSDAKSHQLSIGWPCLTARGSFDSSMVARGSIIDRQEVLYGLRPIWSGFAINTILYASILWSLLFAPGMVKRTIRRRRGQCEPCSSSVEELVRVQRGWTKAEIKRRIIQTVVLLMLGAIVNLAVACAFALRQEVLWDTDFDRFPEIRKKNLGYEIWYVWDEPNRRLHWRSGFPMIAFEAYQQPPGELTPPRFGLLMHRLINMGPGSIRHTRVLPLLPLWPGFAINTIFYAAILWVVFFAPGMVKRTLRRRRGQCPACAYPVGTSPVCTECGKQLA